MARPGEMLAVTGPSGAGKSTLLNGVSLLDRVDSGSISVDGRCITRLRNTEQQRFRRDHLGYLFQDYALIDEISIDANLEIALRTGVRAAQRRQLLEQALFAVGLEGRGHEPVYQLSGGEQQRVAVARLLVKQPTIVLADEPTAALDGNNAERVLDLLKDMARRGCTLMLAMHSLEVQQLCDKVLALSADGHAEASTVRESPVTFVNGGATGADAVQR